MKLDKETFAELSIKEFVASGLELYLSMSLGISFFECPDESRRDEQELQTLSTMAWSPALLSAVIVYAHRFSARFGPAPEHFDRNLRRCKIFTWVYSVLFLIWDKDMTLKRGPALQIAIIFCVCDLVRFELELSGLMDDNRDDDDELERLAAAVDALGNGHDDHQSAKQEYADGGGGNSSIDSLYFEPQKPLRLLERQSTESLSQEYVVMTTPAPTAVDVTITNKKSTPTLESLKAPSTVAPARATEISTDHSLNGEAPLANTNSLSTKDGQPIVFEF